MTIEFRPLSETLGAEVIGVNVADDLSGETIAEIRVGWLRYKILLFRDQDLTIERQKAFAQRFGKLFTKSPTSSSPWIPEHPEVTVLSNIKVEGKDFGGRPDASFSDAWHSDFSYLKEPASGSFFYAKEVPEKGGDDTWYANLTKAFDALPEDTKCKLEGRRWGYSQVVTFERHAPEKRPMTEDEKRNLPDVSHPFVRTHPETGQKALFVGILDTRESSVDGMSKEQGIEFLEELKSFATQPQFTYTHQWRQGDSILWDNRCTMHRATNFPDANGRRLCHRVTIKGGVPY
jgi:taurine dioxygenase